MHCDLKQGFPIQYYIKVELLKLYPYVMLSLLLLSSFAGVIPFLGSSGEPAKEKVETNDSFFFSKLP